jgi:hypothetical protein
LSQNALYDPPSNFQSYAIPVKNKMIQKKELKNGDNAYYELKAITKKLGRQPCLKR